MESSDKNLQPTQENSTLQADTKEQPKLSKNQLKKQLKKEKWEIKKLEKKKLHKEKYKKSKSSYAHISRFKQVQEDSEVPKLSKKEKQNLFKDLCDKGPKYIIDCDFEDYMNDREIHSLGQQLAYCHSINKQLEQPLSIHFTGVGPKLQKRLDKNNCKNWAVNVHSQTYLECEEFPQKKLVYLSADSENLLEDLDSEVIYIIGGIVDHNRYKLLTYNKALKQKIQHARLPIRENVELGASTVLTVNHVFDIIAQYQKTKDWKVTLESAIPERKRKVAEVKEESDSKEEVKEQ